MSTRITHQADGTARGQTQQNTANSIIDLRKQPGTGHHCAGCQLPQCAGCNPGDQLLFETFFSQRLGGIDYGDGQRLVVGRKDETYPGLCELDVIREADTAQMPAPLLHALPDDGGWLPRAGRRTRQNPPLPV